MELRRSEQKHSGRTENLADVVVQLSPDGTLEYASASVQQFGGYDLKEEMGNPVDKYIATQDRAKVGEAILRAVQDQQPHGVEFVFIPKAGEEFPVEVAVFPLIKDGEVASLQCLMRDITERKQTAEVLTIQTEQAQQYLSAYRKVSILEDQEGDKP